MVPILRYKKNLVFSIKLIKHFVLWFGRPRATMCVCTVWNGCSSSSCTRSGGQHVSHLFVVAVPASAQPRRASLLHSSAVRSPRSVPLFYCWLFSSQLTTSLLLTSPRFYSLLTITCLCQSTCWSGRSVAPLRLGLVVILWVLCVYCDRVSTVGNNRSHCILL